MDQYRNRFNQQRSAAKTRGIPWELEYWEWLQIWEDSGHLHETRVCMALEFLGIPDAGAIANTTTYNEYPRDWRQCVRDIARKAT